MSLHAGRFWRWRVNFLWLPASAALTLLLTQLWERGVSRDHRVAVEVNTKGSTELLVYVQRPSGETRLLDRFDRITRPGDKVRFVITGAPDESSFLLVASVDAAGKATAYFPYAGLLSSPLPGPGRWEIPGSIVLDESLGPERVFAFFSASPLQAERVLSELGKLGARGSSAIREESTVDIEGATQLSFLLFREARR